MRIGRIMLPGLALLALAACAPIPPATQAPPATEINSGVATAQPAVTETTTAVTTMQPPTGAMTATITLEPAITGTGTVTATTTLEPAATTTANLRPPSAEVCNGIAQAMMQALPGVEVMQANSPVSFYDPAKNASGTGCQAAAAGTGETFANPVEPVQAIAQVLSAGGWQEDMMLIADGPTGTATGLRSGDLVCQVAANWDPAPEVSCPTDKPISECGIQPNQQLYLVTVDCATSGR